MAQTQPESLMHLTQQKVCDILNEHYEISALNVIPENLKDIEYRITEALRKQGVVAIVMTPTMKFIGTDSGTWNAFEIDDLTIQVVENPLVNRASLNSKTSQDWAYLISDVLTSPLYGHYGSFSLERIESGEDSALLVSKVIVKTCCENQVSSMPQPPDYRNLVPFATRDWVKDNFISSVMSGDYATKAWTLENFLSNDALEGYATEQWVEGKGYLTEHQSLSAITDLIPAQATALNQLADKQFVNSSIATNTAVFRGTYNSVAELPASGITNNDYAFVISTDAHGNTVYNRYKWNTQEWIFEYSLNNSSFTANQWASINSGITLNAVTKLNSYSTVVISGEYEDSTTFNYRMVIEQ